jgi:hypothetical protein
MVLLAQVQADVSDRTSLFGTLCCTCVHCQRSHYINMLLSPFLSSTIGGTTTEIFLKRKTFPRATVPVSSCIDVRDDLHNSTSCSDATYTCKDQREYLAFYLDTSVHPQGEFSQEQLFYASGMVLPTQIESKRSSNVVSISNRPYGLLDKLPRRTAPILVPGVAILPRKIRKKA